MCDYSLYEYKNRLAVEGEELVTHRFRTGSIGLIAWSDTIPAARSLAWVFDGYACAVCLPPGARLELDLTESTRVQATFTQTSMNVNLHRDAVQFANGNILHLQELPTGMKVKVLSLAPVAPAATESAAVPVSVEV